MILHDRKTCATGSIKPDRHPHQLTASICQLGNATVGATQPPAELAIDIQHDDHVGVDVANRDAAAHAY